MSWPAAILVGLALLLYLRFPIDLVPDRVGAIGLLDDLLVLVAGVWWIRRRLARRTTAAPPTGAAWDPWAVLGVALVPGPQALQVQCLAPEDDVAQREVILGLGVRRDELAKGRRCLVEHRHPLAGQ